MWSAPVYFVKLLGYEHGVSVLPLPASAHATAMMRMLVRVHPLTVIVLVASQLTRPLWCTDCCARRAGVHGARRRRARQRSCARAARTPPPSRLRSCLRPPCPDTSRLRVHCCARQQLFDVAALVVRFSTSCADLLPPSVTVVSVPAPRDRFCSRVPCALAPRFTRLLHLRLLRGRGVSQSRSHRSAVV